jgi:hypothetical protein
MGKLLKLVTCHRVVLFISCLRPIDEICLTCAPQGAHRYLGHHVIYKSHDSHIKVNF